MTNLMDPPDHKLLTPKQWRDVATYAKLTARELLVCQTLFSGNTREQIANEIGIGARTVRHHMEQIHLKLAVRNRVGVVLRVIQLRDGLRSRARTSDVHGHQDV